MSEENLENRPYEQKVYFGMAVDPIHIGTGGYRLGRVDNAIARDPTTNLPILFGSSIEGTARSYSAYKLIEDDNSLIAEKGEDRRNYLNCAGKSEEEKEKKRKQCGKCEICVTYGFSTKEESLHGMAQFSDAKLLLFPVHTMVGPVWTTCPRILKDFGVDDAVSEDKIKTNLVDKNKKLNLGWIYLENEGNTTDLTGKFPSILDEICQRIVIVSDALFSHIVNSNLEVRTSVSIDPKTGAAEEGALFTYEAIPRGTVMWFTVTFLNPKNFAIPEDLQDMEMIRETARKGLGLFEHLGIGGMGTRGFGRFKILNCGDENEG